MAILQKISLDQIDPLALDIVKRLQDKGFIAYLVGGCVRDLLLGMSPKDFDISTNARPRQVKRLISNSYIIGRRFRLVLVKRDDLQYEISTFRRGLKPGEDPETLPEGDNIFGSPKEDANRRDYTCNALFFDPIKDKIIDFTSGIEDIRSGWIKMIGDPAIRLPEDPIRILRALRFSHKLSLQIPGELRSALSEFGDELKFSPLPRKREEYLKILRLKQPTRLFAELKDLGLLSKILPTLEDFFNQDDWHHRFSRHLSKATQELPLEQDPTTLFGVFLWSMYQASAQGESEQEALDWISSEKVQEFAKREMGVFNTELTGIEQAFKTIPRLEDFETFERKGRRRQIGLLNQKSFPLALLLYSLGEGLSLSCWLKAYEELSPHFETEAQEDID